MFCQVRGEKFFLCGATHFLISERVDGTPTFKGGYYKTLFFIVKNVAKDILCDVFYTLLHKAILPPVFRL